MNVISHGGDRCRRYLAIAVLSIGLFVPAPLLAHTHLVKSLPAAGARLLSSPTMLRLWFSEAPELVFTHVTLINATGDTIPIGTISRDQTGALAVAASIPEILRVGTYRVLWRTAAADGHPAHGEFTFTIIAVQAAVPIVAPSSSGSSAYSGSSLPSSPKVRSATTGATSFDPLSPMYVAIRWLSLIALLIIIGTVVFKQFVLSASELSVMDASVFAVIRARTAHLGLWAAGMLGAATLARLVAQRAVLDGATVTVLLRETIWGIGWLVQVSAIVLTTLGFALAQRQTRVQGTGWVIATMGAVILAITPALSGHAIATPRFATLAVLNDAGHVVGASGWLGSLLVLAAIALPTLRLLDPADRGTATVMLVNRFSGTALSCAALTGLSTLAQAMPFRARL